MKDLGTKGCSTGVRCGWPMGERISCGKNVAQATFVLNNVNDQISDLYIAENIVCALTARFIFIVCIQIRRQTFGVFL
jgi:hypothetical protein